MLQRLRFIALIACIVLPGSTADARTGKRSTRRLVEAKSARQVSSREHKQDKVVKKNKPRRGQRVMQPERVREIQAALIREKYLGGRADGVWDERSKNAMARFQSDNGWQSQIVPDSRGLIKLGLGPDHAGLMNPETAAITFLAGGGGRSSPSPSQP